jgi:hypothetical protein
MYINFVEKRPVSEESYKRLSQEKAFFKNSYILLLCLFSKIGIEMNGSFYQRQDPIKFVK